ncbi:DsrE family protein [Spirosoma luteum]|uniref:DsrE family protein n=1 Tax=Spirosoma luteum TaxID=431553 RepID=UPI000378E016|nr:DsrE family protein [Spirosoma luteum]
MKKLTYLFALVLLAIAPAMAQTSETGAFHGAEATKSRYRAVYQLNTADTSVISHALANIQNALNDPRLKGKLDMELVVYGGANILYRKDKPQYEQQLQNLQKQGVILAMCENTMRMRKIKREELFPFISYVPTANGELIIRQEDGWAVIRP